MKKISEIAEKVGISDYQLYGDYKAKINDLDISAPQETPLVLVSAITPTKSGEGKTTTTIGLCDGLNGLGVKCIGALREPSLGPVLALKGGACGGGKSLVVPMEDINLHFTGDIHAINTANNFICAVLDNHLYYGNELKIAQILIGRSVDLNDRVMRNLTVTNRDQERTDHGYITVASEIMAIFTLATSLKDLKARISRMVIAIDEDNNFLTTDHFGITDSIVLLLKDAFKVNLVQTLEGSPFFIHGGPFANIAHGCNSILATKLALKYGEVVVSEAGFGFDLGGEKFLDLKCRMNNLKCSLVVFVVSVKALKNLGDYDNNFYNLSHHLNTIRKFGLDFVVAVNKFDTDSEEDIQILFDFAQKHNFEIAISTAYVDGGGIGCRDLAEKVMQKLQNPTPEIQYLYNLEDSFEEKLLKLAQNVYDCDDIHIEEKALAKLKLYQSKGLDKLPLCIAKSPLSLNGATDDTRTFVVTDLYLSYGAGFIVVSCGSIMKMPGLGRTFNAQKITVEDDGTVKGLF